MRRRRSKTLERTVVSNINTAIREAELSIAEVAAVIGNSESRMTKKLTGRKEFEIGEMFVLAQRLNVSASEWFVASPLTRV